jgi:hypothetical protein
LVEPFALTWGTLLLAPPLAAALIHVAGRTRHLVRNSILVGAGTVLTLITGFNLAGVSFIDGKANVAAFCVAYTAYCLLAVGAGLIRRPLVRWPVQLLALTPIGVGYILGTVGWLGLGFIVEDAAAAPMKTETSPAGLLCRVEPWGSVASDSGYTISIYRYWRPLPLRRRIVSLRVNESTQDPQRTCSAGFRAARS